ncbi:hypothetical protein [Salinibacterium sp. PAMC 21357]|nr:hypothetical protein [Salinibacterium sp. PAMC 21357]
MTSGILRDVDAQYPADRFEIALPRPAVLNGSGCVWHRIRIRIYSGDQR